MAKNYTIQKFAAGFMHYIQLDAKTVKQLTINNNKRVIVTLNELIKIHAAIMHTKEGVYYVMLSNKTLKQLNTGVGKIIKASFEIDKTELQFNVPEEITEVLATDDEAKIIFDKLTDGKKRGLIALVNMVKSSDKKIERALKIADKLKHGVTAPQLMLK
jgi:uncharacterized protein YdeI (YjbR/CyaY-like superfamily)